MKSKKGQAVTLSGAPQLVLILLLAVMIAVASAIALNSFKTAGNVRTTSSTTDTNSTFTVLDRAVDFASTDNAYQTDGWEKLVPSSCTLVTVYNASNGANVTNDFTFSGCTATTNNTDLNKTVATASYNYNFYVYSTTYNITEKGERGVVNLAEQVPTIGTVIGVALIVVVVIGAFAWFIGKGSSGAL